MDGDFKTLFRKFCLETSILGLKHFYLYPDFISRCFWAANMLGSVCLACLLSILLYGRFAEMPTRVSIENQFEPVHRLPFPAVTVCSPNQITVSFMTHFNKTLVDGDLAIDLERVLPKLLGFYENLGEDITDDMDQLQSLLNRNRYTISEVMSSIPQSCDEFLRLCYFNGVRYPNCSTLFQPILTTHGLCCTFNNIYHFHNLRNVMKHNFVPRNVTRSGYHEGLIIVTDFNPDDAVDGSIVDVGATRVMLTDYSEFPADDEASLVEAAVEALSALQATLTYCSDDVKVMPVWSRNCLMEHERRLPHFRRYHNSDCDLSCYSQAVRQHCNCTLFFMPGPMFFNEFCNLTKIQCIMQVKVNMSMWQCDCPRDCESRRYKADMITGNFDAIPHMIVDTFEGIKFNNSTTIMNFHFPNFVYMKQRQETVMSIIILISNLGGVFGLCLGCSVMSVLEIMFYVTAALKNYFKGRINERKQISINNVQVLRTKHYVN